MEQKVEQTVAPSFAERPTESPSLPTIEESTLSSIATPTESEANGVVVEKPTENAVVVANPTENAVVVENPTENAVVVENPTKRAVVIEKPTQHSPVIEKPTQHSPVIEKPTERVFKKGVVLKLSPGDKEKLDVARKNLIPKPATAKGLRDDLARGFEKLTIFDNRPRSDFYTVSNANVTQDKPILMDAFTYCENDHLHLDAIFNIKYFVVTMKKRVAYKSLDDLWSAEYRGVVVRNEMKKDNHKHTIVGTFTFPFGCDRHDGDFTVFSNNTHFSYSFAPSFIPSFTAPRYYLSACTSIDFSPHFQVLTWINHHYYEGVQHFTFYLNGRVADWQRLLRPYVEKGLVDVVEYTYPNHRFLFEQNSALNACHRRYRYASRFVLYNDVDEFMLPLNRTWRLVDVVRLYDTSFPQAEAFRVSARRMVQRRCSTRSTPAATTPITCGGSSATSARSARCARRRSRAREGGRTSCERTGRRWCRCIT